MAMDERTLQNLDADALAERMSAALEDEETSRAALLVGGGALTLFGLTRMSPIGVMLALLGGGLVYLGAQRKSLATYGRELAAATGARGEAGIDIEKTITINRPREEVYRFWRDFQNLARFMKHIERVETIDDRRTLWRAKLFRGTPAIEWHAETVEDVPNERIAWRSSADSDIETFGSVRFDSVLGGQATEVRLLLEYRPPAGGIVRLFNPALAQMIKEDLRRFKKIMEGDDLSGRDDRSRTAAPRFEYE